MFNRTLTAAEPILARLVAFDTVSRYSNRACIDFIRDYLDGFGVASHIVASDDGSKACLWATVGNPNAKGVALAGHTDVVPVDGQNWVSDPFTLTERDGKLCGRGAADMKGFIACALAFVPEYLAAKTGGCFHLAFTSDEETDMSGAQRLTDYLIAQQIRPDWFWVGEPTGFTIVNQHKGVAAYQTVFTGIDGHSGQPDKGINAIALAAQFIALIHQAGQARRNQPVAGSSFDPPYSTFNLGGITGGTAANIIARHCEILWELRTHPGDSPTQLVDALIDAAQAVLPPHALMEQCVCYDIPPFIASTDNRGEKRLKQALKCDETHAVSFATEAGIFQKLGGDAIVCGPGFIDQAHQPDEFIDKTQLVTCVDLMRAVLLCSSPA